MNTNKLQKLLVAVFIMVGVCIFVPANSEVQAASTKSTEVYYEKMDIEPYRSGDVYTAPKPTGKGYEDWIFAGWFKGQSEADAISSKTKTGTYYAKFVPAEVLSVKCQVPDETEAGQEGNSKMRIISTIDSKRYNKVGFDITVEGRENPINYESTSVAKSIVARNEGVDYNYSPNIFDLKSNYFITVTINNIPSDYFDKGFFIRPYWVTKDNTKVYGVERYARVEDYYLDIVNVPVRLYSDATVTSGTVEVDYGLNLRELVADTADVNAFTYESFDMGSLLSGVTVTNDTTNRKVICELPEDAEATKADGMLVNMRFKMQTADKEKYILPKTNTFGVKAHLQNAEGTDVAVVTMDSVYQYHHTEYTEVADTTWYTNKLDGQTEFVITTPDELYGFASLVNAGTFGNEKVYLASNITVNDTGIDPTAETWATVSAGLVKWTPIGKVIDANSNWNLDTADFKGAFDGQGHTIKGLYTDISSTSSDTMKANWCAGLFGSVSTTAQIENVKVENSYFKANHYAGSIVGLIKNGTINNTYSDSTVTVVTTKTAAGGIAGGIRSGINGAKGIIQNSWFDGSVSANGSICGGIVGLCLISSEIKNCLNEGSVGTIKHNGGIVGQIGQSTSVSIEDCLNVGTVFLLHLTLYDYST